MSALTRHSGRRRSLLFAIGVLCVGVFTMTTTQAADAASYRYNVINKTSQKNYTGAVFASCKITSTGGTCTITTGKTVTRTIGVTLGASRSEVSLGLNISSADSVTTTVACASPALKAGQVWKARAMGTRYTYKVQKQEGIRPRIGGGVIWNTIGTSGTLSAFDPSRSAISCGL